jgi:ssDNA-binding Zn-finger/Zn-ribbon topoisomerase 1
MRVVLREKLSKTHMTTGGEKSISKVIDGDRVVEWVGIGWIDLREADERDRRRYPIIVEKLYTKIDRVCPRCRTHAYHFYRHDTKRAECANCAHGWRARFTIND